MRLKSLSSSAEYAQIWWAEHLKKSHLIQKQNDWLFRRAYFPPFL